MRFTQNRQDTRSFGIFFFGGKSYAAAPVAAGFLGKFGEGGGGGAREKRKSSSIAQPRVILASCVLSKLPNCIITRYTHG